VNRRIAIGEQRRKNDIQKEGRKQMRATRQGEITNGSNGARKKRDLSGESSKSHGEIECNSLPDSKTIV
jgi:hypothetical protein